MSIRKHPTKPDTWQIIVSQGSKGKQLVFPIQCTEAEALIMDKQINAQIKGERLTIHPTIQQALPQYLEYYGTIASPDIVKDFASVMRRCLLPMFGRLPAHQIIPTQVYSYTAGRLKEDVTHRTIEKELNYLSAMCRWLHVNGMAEKMPIIPKPPKAKTQPKRLQQPLTLGELAALIATTPPDKQVLIMLMSDAGLRVTEALTLKTAEIDVPGSRLTIHGKGGKLVVYPILTDRLYNSIVAAKDKATTEWLVINPKTSAPFGSVKTLLRLASKRAGITKHVTHHTLRHTFSTLLMECGISTESRRLLMRHSTLAATEFYTHVSPGYMQREAGGFSDMINGPSESLKVEKADKPKRARSSAG